MKKINKGILGNYPIKFPATGFAESINLINASLRIKSPMTELLKSMGSIGATLQIKSLAAISEQRSIRATLQIKSLAAISEQRSIGATLQIKSPMTELAKTMGSLSASIQRIPQTTKLINSFGLLGPLLQRNSQMNNISKSMISINSLFQHRLPFSNFVNSFQSISRTLQTQTSFPEIIKSMGLLGTALQIKNPIMSMAKALDSLLASTLININSVKIDKQIEPFNFIVSNVKKSFNKKDLKNYEEEISYDLISKIGDGNLSEKNKIISIAKDISENVTKSKNDILSFQSYLGIIISLIIFIFSLRLSDLDKNKIINAIQNSEEKILNEVKKTQIYDPDDIYYAVHHKTFVYTDFSNKKEKIKIIYPNQKVKLIARKRKWIYIEYFNNIKKIHENGWCLKKHLKLLK